MIAASGVLYVADSEVLLLRYADGPDKGLWCFPGGGIEGGEDARDAAVREFKEETGRDAGDVKMFCRRIKDGVDFITFLGDGEKFNPTLSDEHDGFMWCLPDALPMDILPGALVAIQRLAMNELEIAQAMTTGDLASPQFYKNVALFDIRITGTGAAFRSAHDEFSYRPPENYLTPEFLARCNGLTVVWLHPEDKPTLTSKEFGKSVIGSIFVPYIKGDEVWGIAKIYDAAAIKSMTKEQFSTSPGVAASDADFYSKETLPSGQKLIIEKDPALLDHIAIVPYGVWDKGGEPTGVSLTAIIGDQDMATEAEMADKARRDAEEKARMDAEDQFRKDSTESMKSIADAVKGLCDGVAELRGRMDAFEKKGRIDAEETEAEKKEREEKEKADRARKDAEEEAEKKVLEDKARKDAEEKERADAAWREEISRQVKGLSDADQREMASAQARADEVYRAFNDHAPRPLAGESKMNYRRRLVDQFKKHSAHWSAVDLASLPDAAFDIAEAQIYNDATAASHSPVLPGGEVMRKIERTVNGVNVVEFRGRSFIGQLKPQTQYVTGVFGVRKEG